MTAKTPLPFHTSPSEQLFILAPSQRLKHLLFTIHGLALTASLLAAIPLPIKICLMTIVVASNFWHLQTLAQTHWQFKYSNFHGWQVFIAHQFKPIEILASTVLTPLVVLIHFRTTKHQHYHVIVFNDSLPAPLYRQLIVALKINAAK